MPRKELPHIIDTKGITDPAVAAKLRAIQENLDALTGEATFTESKLSELETRLDEGDLTVPESDVPDTGQSLEDALNEAGEGTPDGSPPASSPAPRAYSILGAIYLLADTIANNSTVTYHFHVSTTNGFTPAANTKVASVQAAGRTGQVASFIVRQFPAGHHLAGQQPSPTTTYYARVVAEDSDGVAPASAQVAASSEMINAGNKAIYLGANIIEADMLVADAIDGMTITGATIISPNANAGTWRVEISGPSGWPVRYWDGATVNFALKANGDIYARGEIHALSGTFAGSLSAATGTFAGSLSAASGTFVGTVSAGAFNGGSITGATFVTTTDALGQAARVRIRGDGDRDKILFDYSVSSAFTRQAALYTNGMGALTIEAVRSDNANNGTIFLKTGTTTHIIDKAGVEWNVGSHFTQGVRVDGRFQVGQDASAPDTNHITIYQLSGTQQVWAKFPDGTTKRLDNV